MPYTSSSQLEIKNPGAKIEPGDIIYLRSGNFGELNITSYYNQARITIAAEAGHKPVFRNIVIRSSRNWLLQGIHVNAATYPEAKFSTLISLESHNWTGPIDRITIDSCQLRSVSDSSGWSKTDWNTKAKSGIGVSGSDMEILNNSLVNVNFGISVSATESLIKGNLIENFAGDGLRGLGDYTVFENNIIKNCYDVNENHDDGFQSWSVGTDGKVGTGVVKGIVLRGNTFINYEDSNQPFRGSLQGIGCFDGMFEDWLVEENVVKVDHWHGISLYGAINSIVRNNSVVDLDDTNRIGPPWIMLNTHKNNTPPRGNLVTCNVAPKYIIASGPGNISEFNSVSLTGGPRNSQCPSLFNINSAILPVILNRESRE